MNFGIRGLHHLGVSVPDLEAAKAFYVDTLGFELVDEDRLENSDLLDGVTGLRHVSCQMMLLRLGNLHMEVFQFHSPQPVGERTGRPVNEYGYTHLAFEVSDVQQAYEQLKEAGVAWNFPPVEIAPGYWTTYGRDPFGNVLEIQQVSESKSYSFSKLPLLR